MLIWVLFPYSWDTAVIWLMQLTIIGCFFPLLRRRDELLERALIVGAIFTAIDSTFISLNDLRSMDSLWITTVGGLAFYFFIWTACAYVGMRLCELRGIDYWGFRTFAKGRMRHFAQYIGISTAWYLYCTALVDYSKTESQEVATAMDTLVEQMPAGMLVYVLPEIQYEVIERGAYLGILLTVIPRGPFSTFAAANLAALLCTFGCGFQSDLNFIMFLQVYPTALVLGYLFLRRGLLATVSVVVMTSVAWRF